jgi:hypothetical protein
LVAEGVDCLDGVEFSFGVCAEVEVGEGDLLIMFVGMPNEFGVVVGAPVDVVVGPFVIFGSVYCHWFAVLL